MKMLLKTSILLCATWFAYGHPVDDFEIIIRGRTPLLDFRRNIFFMNDFSLEANEQRRNYPPSSQRVDKSTQTEDNDRQYILRMPSRPTYPSTFLEQQPNPSRPQPPAKDYEVRSTTPRSTFYNPTTTYRPNESRVPPVGRSPSFTHNDFNTNLFYIVAHSNPHKNVVISPLSMQTLLGMINIGAAGETSQQLQYALALPNDKDESAAVFRGVYRSLASSPQVKIQTANKLFYRKSLGNVNRNFRQYIETSFGGEVEGINFEQPSEAVRSINKWAADRTQNRITQIVTPDQLGWDTNAVLANAVYFKAKWQKQFSSMDTRNHEFYVSSSRVKNVEMMYVEDVFNYAELPDLGAKVLEMPYANSNISMVFILPNEVDGLSPTEENLKNQNMERILSEMKRQEVKVRLPKFKIAMEIDMTKPLEGLGVSRIFSDDADLPYVLDEPNGLKVSTVLHKAVLEVNEAGSEAAATSFANFVPLALPVRQKEFSADHPFIFMIKSPQAILFMGHYVG